MQEQQPTKNKAGRKFLPYHVRPFNVRLDTRLIDRMNQDKVDKTALVHLLLRNHFAEIDKKALHNS
jgi:hypothetical protein